MSMVPMQESNFGKPIAIYARYKLLEDGTKQVGKNVVVYSGRALAIAAANDGGGAYLKGELIPLATNVKPYGLAKFQKNVYADDVNGGFGMYGSGKGAVCVLGIYEVMQNTFTLNDGTEVAVKVFDDAVTYAPGEKIYVNLTSGLLTNVLVASGAGQNDLTYLGDVLAGPSATDGTLQILLVK